MGLFVDGEWIRDDFVTKQTRGAFERSEVSIRNWILADGSTAFPPVRGRYHLYVSLACPWAHRTLITRALKGLDEAIDVSVVHPYMGERGWSFDTDFPGATGDRLGDADFLGDVYVGCEPSFTGRVTVPLLFDRETESLVNNESSEVLRIFDQEMAAAGAAGPELWPASLRDALEPLNERIYETVNNGVYKAGFAGSQRAYDRAVRALFDTLDVLESRLEERTFLVGEQLTEADIRLFVTLVRFDAVYHQHFKCNLRRLVDYPNLWSYTRELYQSPGFRETTDFDHIREHYYTSHPSINPSGVVPAGPEIDWSAAPDRAQRMDVPSRH